MAACQDDARYTHEGSYNMWLHKEKSEGAKTKWLGLTVRRYFTIDFDQKLLTCARTETGKEVSLRVSFASILGASTATDEVTHSGMQRSRSMSSLKSGPSSKDPSRFGFVLQLRDQKVRLWADRRSDMVSWIEMLSAASIIGKDMEQVYYPPERDFGNDRCEEQDVARSCKSSRASLTRSEKSSRASLATTVAESSSVCGTSVASFTPSEFSPKSQKCLTFQPLSSSGPSTTPEVPKVAECIATPEGDPWANLDELARSCEADCPVIVQHSVADKTAASGVKVQHSAQRPVTENTAPPQKTDLPDTKELAHTAPKLSAADFGFDEEEMQHKERSHKSSSKKHRSKNDHAKTSS